MCLLAQESVGKNLVMVKYLDFSSLQFRPPKPFGFIDTRLANEPLQSNGRVRRASEINFNQYIVLSVSAPFDPSFMRTF